MLSSPPQFGALAAPTSVRLEGLAGVSVVNQSVSFQPDGSALEREFIKTHPEGGNSVWGDNYFPESHKSTSQWG